MASDPYPSDALRYVAAEVRFPPADELSEPRLPPAVREALRDGYPNYVSENGVVPPPPLPGGVPPASPTATVRHRFLTRSRLSSVVVSRDSIVLETTDYPGWTAFRDAFRAAVEAVTASTRIDGIGFVGLRYMDEVRVSAPINTPSDWSRWITRELVEPALFRDGPPPDQMILALQYGTPPGLVTNFRAVPFRAGRTVQTDGPLAMPYETPSGPYFLIDTDSSWLDPKGELPPFEIERLLKIADEVHAPCPKLFEKAITDELRDTVLLQPREDS